MKWENRTSIEEKFVVQHGDIVFSAEYNKYAKHWVVNMAFLWQEYDEVAFRLPIADSRGLMFDQVQEKVEKVIEQLLEMVTKTAYDATISFNTQRK